MASDAWKKHERAVAKRLGGQRAGPTGKTGSDVLHPAFAIEAKERKSVPKYLEDFLDQAERSARPEQLPIVVLHKLGKRHDNDIVLIRLRHFEDWYGGTES